MTTVKGKLVAGGAVGLILGSAALMNFVEKWESGGNRVLVVYADKLANGLPTVCNGLTKYITDTPIVVGERWTDEKCEAEERHAMVYRVQIPLLKCIGFAPPQSVFDALSSHGWNFGVAKTCASGAAQYIRAGDYANGCQRIAYSSTGKPVWSSAQGKFVPGLFKRRKDEVAFCLRDVS